MVILANTAPAGSETREEALLPKALGDRLTWRRPGWVGCGVVVVVVVVGVGSWTAMGAIVVDILVQLVNWVNCLRNYKIEP